MRYVLETETRATFDNKRDAERYFRQAKDDDEYAVIDQPRRNPRDGLYVVRLTKSETVHVSAH